MPPRTGASLVRGPTAYLLLAAAILLVAFRKFLFFDAVYLYKDIAGDSINYTYPQLSRMIAEWGTSGLPGWSFRRGLGQDVFPFSWNDPFLAIPTLFGRSRLAFGLFPMEAAKILCAGLFFRLYLRELALSEYSSTVGALLYSFSGYVILGGAWTTFSTEAVYCAFLLFAFERFLRRGSPALLPWPIALLAMLQPFYLYPYALLLAAYGTARFVDERGWKPRAYLKFALSAAAPFLVGALLGGVYLLPELRLMLESPRVSGTASLAGALASRSPFALDGAARAAAAVLRFFGNDLLGTGSHYRGWGNFLEAPLFYGGLSALLLAPQAFAAMSRPRRRIYGGLAALCLLPAFFPYARYAFWAFRADYYRTLGLFVLALMLFLAMSALNRLDQERALDRKLLAGSLAAALLLLFGLPRAAGLDADAARQAAAAAFLAADAAALVLLSSGRFARAARAVFLALVCLETAWSARGTAVAGRDVVTVRELSERTGYNDGTVDAVAALRTRDASFYRVEKDYRSGPVPGQSSYNDAEVQDYDGVSAYSQFNQPSTVAFLAEMGLLDASRESETRWVRGVGASARMMSLVGVKYFLTKSAAGAAVPFASDPVGTFGGVRVLRNRRALPLGFTYDRCLTRDELDALDAPRRQAALLDAFSAEDGDCAGFPPLPAAEAAAAPSARRDDAAFAARTRDVLSIFEFGSNAIRGKIRLDRRKLLFFSIPADPGWSARVDGAPARLQTADVGFMGLPLGPGEHLVELSFEPPLRRLGAAVSLLGILIYALVLFRRNSRRREF